MQNNEGQTAKTVPDGCISLTPWLISRSSADLIEFLRGAFNAEETPNSRITNDEGIIIHVAVTIGEAVIMLFDSREGWGPSPGFLRLYVEDIEDVLRKSIELGATPVTDITTLWFGEKVCRLMDPFGNLWWLNQRLEEVDLTDPEVVEQRSTTPEAVEKIAYIQRSLDEAMKIQKKFFEDQAKN